MSIRRRNLRRLYGINIKLRKDGRITSLDTPLREFYIGCPEDKTVDHIIPLRGKNVSGLHIAENLQYLSQKENSKKRNYFGEFQGWTKEFEKEYMQEYAKNNHEKILSIQRRYREQNRESVRTYHRDYQRKLRSKRKAEKNAT